MSKSQDPRRSDHDHIIQKPSTSRGFGSTCCDIDNVNNPRCSASNEILPLPPLLRNVLLSCHPAPHSLILNPGQGLLPGLIGIRSRARELDLLWPLRLCRYPTANGMATSTCLSQPIRHTPSNLQGNGRRKNNKLFGLASSRISNGRTISSVY
jgi:hypothetical protein